MNKEPTKCTKPKAYAEDFLHIISTYKKKFRYSERLRTTYSSELL